MADVFLSYAREDSARAEQIANGLQAAGLDVFWDNEIPPGTTWADYIESKLNQCRALIVLWSEHSTKSQWVREEARLGRDRGCLIPVLIDASQPPFGFGEVHAADLSAWNGGAGDANWRRFVDAVMNIAKTSPRAAPQPAPVAPIRAAASPPRASPAETKQRVPVWVWVAGAVIGTIVVLGIIGSMMPQQQVAGPTLPDQQPVMNQPQQPSGDRNPQQTLAAQMQQVQAALTQQGYQPVGQPFSASLQSGQTQDIPAEMHVGYEYQIVGVCDQDCLDLDLRLFDGNGGLIVEDIGGNNQPNVGVTPTSTGMFTIQARMYECTVAPCYYAVALYARQRM
jgi:hypothetical protein